MKLSWALAVAFLPPGVCALACGEEAEAEEQKQEVEGGTNWETLQRRGAGRPVQEQRREKFSRQKQLRGEAGRTNLLHEATQ